MPDAKPKNNKKPTTKKQQDNSKARVVGRPFPKGTSGNPAGRPLKGDSMAELFRKYGDRKNEKEFNKSKLIKVIYDKALTGDLKAADMVFDRIDGKPRQAIEHVGAVPVYNGDQSPQEFLEEALSNEPKR